MKTLNANNETANKMYNNIKSNNIMDQMKAIAEDATVIEESNNVHNMTNLEQLKVDLQAQRKKLSSLQDEPTNILKTMDVNIRRTEKALKESLEKQELPVIPVEFWKEEESSSERTSYSKTVQQIIIATTIYNMDVTKVTIEKGKELLNEERLEKNPLYVTPAQLFEDNNIELRDLNGNVIPKGTENVFVALDMAYDFWKFKANHAANIDAIINDNSLITVENVRIREFSSLQDYALYEGINNVLSRGMTGTEKAGIASLATQNEFFQKVFEVSKSLKISFSTVTKYYNTGKTLTGKVWNEAMLGNVPDKFEYDLTKGDTILATLDKKNFSDKVKKERYLIDALTQLYNYLDPTPKELVGFDKALSSLQALDETKVKIINATTDDKLNTIYSILFEEYINIRDAKQTAA